MNTIPFTQYMRPNGQARQQFFDCDAGLADKAWAIINQGYRFECEVLRNDMCSLTISNGEEDLAVELVANGPKVPEAVQRLVEKFYQETLA